MPQQRRVHFWGTVGLAQGALARLMPWRNSAHGAAGIADALRDLLPVAGRCSATHSERTRPYMEYLFYQFCSVRSFCLISGTALVYKNRMNRKNSSLVSSFTAALAASVVSLSPMSASASDVGPIYSFDFTDSFYLANGINPAAIVNRINGSDGTSVVDIAIQSNRRNVRALLTIPTYSHSGNIFYFHAFGFLMPNSFTNNAAGVAARELAESANLYAFPRAANTLTQLFPKRQEDVSDLRDGYFSNNPMGLWKISYVRFTPAATETSAGRAALADLASRNGKDLDGTPIIRTIGEIESLRDDGFVTVRAVPVDGSEGPPWFSCPVMHDPRDGAIAPDAFLEVVKDANGVVPPTSAAMLQEFQCLKNTGDYCN